MAKIETLYLLMTLIHAQLKNHNTILICSDSKI